MSTLVSEAPTPHEAVAEARQVLAAADAVDLNEAPEWELVEQVGALSEVLRQVLAVVEGGGVS
jgi:hypothetical protein